MLPSIRSIRIDILGCNSRHVQCVISLCEAVKRTYLHF